jgi:hypothetical protein
MRSPSDQALRRLSWVVPALLTAVFAAAVPIAIANADPARGTWQDGGPLTEVLFGAVVLSFPLTGLLIVRQQPRNRIGWLLQGIGAAWGVTGLTDTYATYGLVMRPGSLPGAEVAAALNSGGWAPSVGLMGTFLLLLYPDGHLPSRRWRHVARLSALTIVAVTVVITVSPGPLEVAPDMELPNPLGLEPLRPVLVGALYIALPLLPLCILASAAGLVRRFRGSHGVERLQLKWLATAGATLASLYLCGMVASLPRIASTSGQGDPGWLVVLQNITVLAFVLLPVSIGVAILRHRLYDIDVVINRALVYGALTAALAGVYLGSVLVLQLVLRPVTSRSDLAVAASTLAVAALFRPVRARIQAVVDRRFFRQRYDAGLTLDAFATRLRHELDLESVGADLRSVVHDTVAPAHVSLWLRGSP